MVSMGKVRSCIQSSLTGNAKSRRPQIALTVNSKFPWKLRQTALEKIFDAIEDNERDPFNKALHLENDIYLQSMTRQVYCSLFSSRIIEIRDSTKYISIHENNTPKLLPHESIIQYVHDRSALLLNGYILPDHLKTTISEVLSTKTGIVPCIRCQTKFDPKSYYYSSDSHNECQFHERKKIKLNGVRLYKCCNKEIGSAPCYSAPWHVFYQDPDPLNFINLAETPTMETQSKVLALDCEMVYTTLGIELARFSCVNWDEKTIADLLVKPIGKVIDWNTRFSGLSESNFIQQDFPDTQNIGGVVDYSELRENILPRILGPSTILVGHSLENDLKYLGLFPVNVIDTSMLFPHELRQEAKISLRDLCAKHLQEFIQEGSNGHNSVEDAIACIRLLKKYIKTM